MSDLQEMQLILRDTLAAQAHITWANWMDYLFAKSILNEDGSVTIPKELVDRWKRQMNTKFSALPEEEKKSDREIAAHLMCMLHASALKPVLNEYELFVSSDWKYTPVEI
jgi:hypothetical protein